jgi:RNA polymerase sigma-70 factor (ECF subfamily)
MTAAVADPLRAAALRLARRSADADDLVQDTLFRAWRSLATFRRGSRFEAWIFRILHNAFLNRVRHERHAPAAADPATIEDDALAPAATDDGDPGLATLERLPDLADRHFDERVKAAVDELPETYRVPFVLFSLAEMSYEEIAATLGIPIGTVMSRLHRARNRLRVRLAAYAREARLGEARLEEGA